jgi:hypothetical protein
MNEMIGKHFVTPRDWLDNLEHEDGFTPLRCYKCSLDFRGWKLKKVCRICSVPEFPTGIRHITHVAVIHDGVTYSLAAPDRHHHVLREIYKIKEECTFNTQGFLDNQGVFVTRLEAIDIALAANQIKDTSNLRTTGLFSEDLW